MAAGFDDGSILVWDLGSAQRMATLSGAHVGPAPPPGGARAPPPRPAGRHGCRMYDGLPTQGGRTITTITIVIWVRVEAHHIELHDYLWIGNRCTVVQRSTAAGMSPMRQALYCLFCIFSSGFCHQRS